MTQVAPVTQKCPHCQNDIAAMISVCPVCHVPIVQVATSVEDKPGPVCPKCDCVNPAHAMQCAMCHFPLTPEHPLAQNSRAENPTESEGKADYALTLRWIKGSPGFALPHRVAFFPLTGYPIAVHLWNGYAFFLCDLAVGVKAIVRRIDGDASMQLFYRSTSAAVLGSDSDFYIGDLQIKLCGGLHAYVKNPALSAETVPVGPGEDRKAALKPARPSLVADTGVRISHADLPSVFIPIHDGMALGHAAIAAQGGQAAGTLQEHGVAEQHVHVTALPGMVWLIQAIHHQPYYLRIQEQPVAVLPGERLRWVSGSQFGEFSFASEA